ncbi:MAG: cob(I)yrinic acid a,c-diamide adenosyltransferase [Chlamydiae bacterium]|nr:cob(I)yrinic acid a,c-diamide adenosyltransferase [Chlamydiota bacterium]MBI3277238.1 cob(I)yrinic acid a,c-diamide adenosyltransferase [Chlamydiota bacterium]
MKIYTQTGDQGKTGLIGGARVWKDDLRIEAYGTVDELNGAMGMACGLLENSKISKKIKVFVDTSLKKIQSELFDLGCQLANPKSQGNLPQISEESVKNLELLIDQMERDLPPLKQFILPGGPLLSGCLHLARGICRRAERRTIQLSKKESVDLVAIRYLNRLSDLLFVFARWLQHKMGFEDIPWKNSRLGKKN